MKYKSELINEILEDRGHKESSLHYESECVEKWIEETKGAYPKLCDYEGEWLNYYLENVGIGEFPYLALNNITSTTVENTVPIPFKSAILSGNTLVNLAPQVEDTVIRDYYQGEYVMLTPHITPLSNLKANTKYTVIFKTSNITNAIEGMFHYQGMSTDYSSFFENIGNYTLVNGHNKLLFTTAAEFSRIQLMFYSTLSYGGSFTIHGDSIMFLEGDHTQEDIAYFEGMQSVKMPVLTTTGKNLMDINSRDINSVNYHGVTYSIDANGYYSIKGTLTSVGRWVNTFDLTKSDTWGNNTIITEDFMLKKGTYTLSACDISGETSTPFRFIRLYKKPFISVAQLYNRTSTTFTLNEDTKLSMMLQTLNYNSGDSIDVKFKVQIEEGTQATPYEPFKSNILTVNEDVTLRSNGDICDELNLLTGQLTQRIGEDGVVLSQEVVKTVDLSIIDESGNSVSKLKAMNGITHIETNGTPLNPTFSGEIPVEAITQNLNSFIEEE